MSDIYRATQPFMFVDKQGVHRQVATGDLMSSADPSFKGREGLFEKVEVYVDRSEARRYGAGHSETASVAEVSETASAAPEERRSFRSRRPKVIDTTSDSPPETESAE